MTTSVSAILRLIRPQQWIKNVFVAAAPLFAHRLTDRDDISAVALTIVVFCMVSSAVYVFNDLIDCEADRAHPKKRLRPIASGAVAAAQAWSLIVLLLAMAATVFWAGGLSPRVAIVILCYIVINIGYSLWFKAVALLELFFVASGFVIRLIAGGISLGVQPSPWIISATGLLALLMVAGKRRAEIADTLDPDLRRVALAGYNLAFLDSVISSLSAVTIVTYLMFVVSDYAGGRYNADLLLFSSIFVVYGVLRYVQLVKVMSGADAPTTLVIGDTGLRTCVLLWGLLMLVAVYAGDALK